MKIKPEFQLQNVCGEHVVLGTGMACVNYDLMIRLNSTGAFLWEEAAKGEFTVESLVEALLAEYEVSPQQAETDVTAFVEKLKEAELLQ